MQLLADLICHRRLYQALTRPEPAEAWAPLLLEILVWHRNPPDQQRWSYLVRPGHWRQVRQLL